MGANALSWAQCVLSYTARHREWLQANDARAQLSDAMRRFFARFDVLLAPSSPTPFRMISDRSGGVNSSVLTDMRLTISKC
jgi:Asp-tRNA(Asn)/Glu-tRNA(Gln) amidotransferase A subunit family amidase